MSIHETRRSEKAELEARLRRDTAEFLKNGGKIQRIANGENRDDIIHLRHLSGQHRRRLLRQRWAYKEAFDAEGSPEEV